MDYNSSENQKIKSDFVNREVYYCASSLIYQLEQDGHYTDEILELSLKYEIREDFINEMLRDYKEDVEEWLEDTFTERPELEDLDGEELRDLANHLGVDIGDYEEAVEVCEHWIVSDWLADKLEACGELITKDFLGLTIWGRTCTGQAISLDWVISKICEDLGMLKEDKVKKIDSDDPDFQEEKEKVFEGR